MSKDQIKKIITEGIRFQKEGNPNASIIKYEEVLKIDINNHDALHLMGVALHQIGKHDEAIDKIERSFKTNNKNSIAFNNLGTIYSHLKNYTKAISCFNEAIKLNKNHSDAYFNKANALKASKNDFKLIEKLYLKSIEINKNNKYAYNNLAVLYYENNLFEKSIIFCNKAIGIDGNYFEAYNNKGNALRGLLKYEEAEENYNKSIEINKEYSSGLMNLAVLYKDTKRYDLALAKANEAKGAGQKANINKVLAEIYHAQEKYNDALKYFYEVIKENPDDPDAYNNAGVTLSALKNYEKSLQFFESAINNNEKFANAYFNKGNTLVALKKYDEAIEAYNKAIQINDQKEEYYNNKGTTLIELKKFKEAIPEFEKALKLNPNNGAPYYNIGNCYFDSSDYRAAEINYRKSNELGTNVDFSGGLSRHMKSQMCDWDNYKEEVDLLIEKNNQGLRYASPFLMSFISDDLKNQKVAAELMAEKFATTEINVKIKQKINTDQKIKIGYFSSDFKNHPVSFLIAEHLELHNRELFEIHAFSYNMGVEDNMTARIKNGVDFFHNIKTMSDDQVVKLCNDLSLDIAIDLNGYTSGNRTLIFSKRVAPIQIGYLGFLGTLGSNYYEYLIADKVIIPEKNRIYYNEKILYLPHYQVSDRKRVIASNNKKRKDYGLKEDAFIYCCFNNNYKINSEIFVLWMEILKRTNNSYILLYEENKYTRDNLIKEAKKNGVESERLVFAQKIPLEEHLHRYTLCDLFLDTSPYNAGTTANDALWAGLPVLTKIGNTFSARMAASILTSHGVEELIAADENEYKNIAIKMCTNNDFYIDVKTKVQDKKNSKLFNIPAFTKSFEKGILLSIECLNKNYKCDISVDEDFYNQSELNMKNDFKIMNFDNPIFWGTREPEIFKDLIKTASKLTGAYHFSDNLFVFSRSLSMLRDEHFMDSWKNNIVSQSDGAIIWRRFILAMAGYHCQNLDGDFVECGAYEGVGAKTVIDYLGGPNFKKKFWLYDIFEHSSEMENHAMPNHGPQLYQQVSERFLNYPNVEIIKGFIPNCFSINKPDKIAYLHIDLNQVTAEIACLDHLFDKIVPGGIIIFDDYEMLAYHAQKVAEDNWLEKKGYKVFALPTSQGLVIKR